MIIRCVYACLLAIGASGWLIADDLAVSSQNTLHLSDSVKGANKRATIKKQNEQYNVNLLQEVMKSADLSQVKPGTYKFLDSDLKGKSSYKERYAFIYDTAVTAIGGDVEDYPDYDDEFARPPAAILCETSDGTLIWFVDFHAIWGKSVSQRRNEAIAMAKVYKYYQKLKLSGKKTDNVVMAGDWNLSATDTAFKDLKALNNDVTPNMDTSLTKSGGPSEPYDHFVATKKTLEACALTSLQGKTTKWWRDNVSDHRGVDCSYVY